MTPIQTLAWQVIGSASDLGHLLFSERRDLQWLRRHQKLPIINEESGTVCNEGPLLILQELLLFAGFSFSS